jgi:nitroreductase
VLDRGFSPTNFQRETSAMNETLKTIHKLHTTHGDFLPNPVPREQLEAILDASVRAANAANAQNYAIIVVEDQVVMKEVAGYVAPVMLLYCVDLQRNIDLAEHLGCTYAGDPAWVMLTGVSDAAFAAQTAVIAAQSLGLNTLLTNGTQRGDPRRIWKLLDLPARNCFPTVALYLGYGAGQAARRSARLKEPGVIHRGKYQRRDTAVLDQLLAITDTPGFSDLKWRDEGHPHCLTAFFKGPGKRAVAAYGQVAAALAEAGIEISTAPSAGGASDKCR